MKHDLTQLQDIQEMIDITDSGLIQSLDYNDETNESRPVWYIGSRGDDSAGLPATQYTPFFPSLEELNAFCVRHIDFVGSIPEGEEIPYLDCDHHDAIRQKLDEDGAPEETTCSKCHKHLELCECYDGELRRPDPTCRVCFGRGWVVKMGK